MQSTTPLIQTCDLHTHPLCFAKALKTGPDFQCDQCAHAFPEHTHCELCPLLGGNFLELIDYATAVTYRNPSPIQDYRREMATFALGSTNRNNHKGNENSYTSPATYYTQNALIM